MSFVERFIILCPYLEESATRGSSVVCSVFVFTNAPCDTPSNQIELGNDKDPNTSNTNRNTNRNTSVIWRRFQITEGSV